MVHDGNRYFERCYGADFDVDRSLADREACWQAWIAHYSRNQSTARVDYAMLRVEALQSGEPGPELPGVNAGPKASPAQSVVDLAELAPPQAGAEVASGCLGACNEFEHACIERCPSGNTTCRHGCARERAICLRGCH